VRIPVFTRRERFYVATSEKHAFSSWDTLAEAMASWERLKIYDPKNAKFVVGIQRVVGYSTTWPTKPEMRR